MTMTIERKERAVNRQQVKKLEAIHFWKREINYLNSLSDSIQKEYDLKQADLALRYKIKECDNIGIAYSIQNIVLGYQDVHTDILDVMYENNIIIKGDN